MQGHPFEGSDKFLKQRGKDLKSQKEKAYTENDTSAWPGNFGHKGELDREQIHQKLDLCPVGSSIDPADFIFCMFSGTSRRKLHGTDASSWRYTADLPGGSMDGLV